MEMFTLRPEPTEKGTGPPSLDDYAVFTKQQGHALVFSYTETACRSHKKVGKSNVKSVP